MSEKDRLSRVQIALALPVEQDMVSLVPMPVVERMAANYRVLGMSTRYHPLGLMRPRLPVEFVTSADLPSIRDGQWCGSVALSSSGSAQRRRAA
jgi:hypothetical protein